MSGKIAWTIIAAALVVILFGAIRVSVLQTRLQCQEQQSSRDLEVIDSLINVNSKLNADHITDSILIINLRRNARINNQLLESQRQASQTLNSLDSIDYMSIDDKINELSRLLSQKDSAGWKYLRSAGSNRP